VVIKYDIFPTIEGEPEIPMNQEPVSLHDAFQIIEQRMALLSVQGYWRGCNCQEIPIEQVGFAIRPSDSDR
jgi:hypothetical protein